MEDFNVSDIANQIIEEVKKEYQSMNKLNVMILGKTGVGKSTLINNMFSRNLAETGIGLPVTDKIQKFEYPDFPLAIFDTPGLELSGKNAVDTLLKDVMEQIKKGVYSGNTNEMIHCIWYCVSTPSHRFEQTEIDFMKKFLDNTKIYNIPVIIVLTQSFVKKDAETLEQQIKKENLNVPIVPILAQDYEIDDKVKIPAYGLNTLSNIMNKILPKEMQKTFITVQRANIELKKDKAQFAVTAAAVASFAIGATPIPFSDAALLVPTQISMMASISVIFGIDIDKSSLVSIISATIGVAGTTVLGKTVVANLLKLIPGGGSIAGGTISGTTAAALTTALGEAYIVVMINICKGKMKLSDLQTRKGKKELKKIFKEKLKLKRDYNDVAL